MNTGGLDVVSNSYSGFGEASGWFARSKPLTIVKLFGQDLSDAEREKKEEAPGLRTKDY